MKNIELTREASGIIMEVEKLLIGEERKNIVVIMFNNEYLVQKAIRFQWNSIICRKLCANNELYKKISSWRGISLQICQSQYIIAYN